MPVFSSRSPKRERRRLVVGAEAAEQRAHPRDQLLQGERLHEVVVGPGLEPGDAIRDLVARGQHQDRELAAVGPQPPRQLEPVEPRHQDVDDREVDRVRVRAQLQQRLLAVDGQLDVVSLHGKRAAQRVAHGLLVIDNQDRHPRNGGHSGWEKEALARAPRLRSPADGRDGSGCRARRRRGTVRDGGPGSHCPDAMQEEGAGELRDGSSPAGG